MILIIGLTIIFVACVILAFILSRSEWNYETTIMCLVGGAIICGIFAITLGSVAIGNNTPYSHISARVEYEEKVSSLTATYNTLVTIDDTHDKYTGIQQYNNDVKEFKTDIIKTQKALKNPLINWCYNYEYKNFDANIVSYIEVK